MLPEEGGNEEMEVREDESRNSCRIWGRWLTGSAGRSQAAVEAAVEAAALRLEECVFAAAVH